MDPFNGILVIRAMRILGLSLGFTSLFLASMERGNSKIVTVSAAALFQRRELDRIEPPALPIQQKPSPSFCITCAFSVDAER